jgi:hypothetical protein
MLVMEYGKQNITCAGNTFHIWVDDLCNVVGVANFTKVNMSCYMVIKWKIYKVKENS